MTEERRTKILLLDDEKMLLTLFRVKFEQQGFDVYTCTDADDALKVLRYGYMPDVILFDITMPGMSGYEFLETVKKEKLGGSPCLMLALTNEGQDGEIKRILELGADGHLMKAAYLPSELVIVVQEMLKKTTVRN